MLGEGLASSCQLYPDWETPPGWFGVYLGHEEVTGADQRTLARLHARGCRNTVSRVHAAIAEDSAVRGGEGSILHSPGAPRCRIRLLWSSAAVFHQKDLGFSFNRQGCGAYAFNHGFSFSDRLWFLDWISNNPGEGDPWSAENDQFVDSKKLKNMYFLSFDTTVGAGCYFPGKQDSVRNDVACKAPLKRVPGPPMALDKVMRFGSISYGTVKNHLGRYAAHVLESLDLPVEFDRDRQENLVFTSSEATKCLDVP